MEKRIFEYKRVVKEEGKSKLEFVCETGEIICITLDAYEDAKTYGDDSNVEYVGGKQTNGFQPEFIDVHVWKTDIVFRIGYMDYCCNFYCPVPETYDEY